MTVSQLYKSVAQLGFEDSLESEVRFVLAANRALLQVNALRPATSAYIINHKPLKNMVANSTFEPIQKTDDLFFYAENVKSYYFETDGIGSVWIEKYNEESEEWEEIGLADFNDHCFTAHYDLIKDDGKFTNARVRLHFVGQYLYSVKNVAMYQYVYSDDKEDIPAYEPFTKYDISALTTDFLTLASPPITEVDGVEYLNQGYEVENNRVILLPHDAKGLFKVIYNKTPKNIIETGEAITDETLIDLDEDLCALLPVLVASYIWVDDEPEKAQYYFTLYKDRAADIERRIYSTTPVHIKSINGW